MKAETLIIKYGKFHWGILNIGKMAFNSMDEVRGGGGSGAWGSGALCTISMGNVIFSALKCKYVDIFFKN